MTWWWIGICLNFRSDFSGSASRKCGSHLRWRGRKDCEALKPTCCRQQKLLSTPKSSLHVGTTSVMAAVAVSVSRLSWREIRFHFATMGSSKKLFDPGFSPSENGAQMLKLVNLVGFLISQLISKSIKLPKRIRSFLPFSAPKKGAPACHAEFLGLNISGYSCERIQWVFSSSQSSEYNLRNWTRRILLLWLLFWHLHTAHSTPWASLFFRRSGAVFKTHYGIDGLRTNVEE